MYNVDICYADNSNKSLMFYGPPDGRHLPNPVKYTRPYFDSKKPIYYSKSDAFSRCFELLRLFSDVGPLKIFAVYRIKLGYEGSEIMSLTKTTTTTTFSNIRILISRYLSVSRGGRGYASILDV